MLLLQALFTAFLRSIGRIFNTAIGWATVVFFGKAPDDRQTILSVMAFGSIVWLAVALGIDVSPASLAAKQIDPSEIRRAAALTLDTKAELP